MKDNKKIGEVKVGTKVTKQIINLLKKEGDMTQAGIARIIGKSPSFVYRAARGDAALSIKDVIKLGNSVQEPLVVKIHDIVQAIPDKVSWLSHRLVTAGKKVTAAGKNLRKKTGGYLKELGEYLESLDRER